MKRSRHAGLIALNAALLAALAAVSIVPAKVADAQGVSRVRGAYAPATTRIQGGPEGALFVIDAANDEMIGVRWERGRRTLSPIGYRDLALDAQAPTGGGR